MSIHSKHVVSLMFKMKEELKNSHHKKNLEEKANNLFASDRCSELNELFSKCSNRYDSEQSICQSIKKLCESCREKST